MNKEELALHYKKYIRAKMYHNMEFAEYLSQKLQISEITAYQVIKINKPVFA